VSRGRLAAAALVAAQLAAAPAFSAERSLVLEVIINGRSTGQVGEFIDRDGALYVKPAELRELGFAVSDDIDSGTEPIPLSSLPNVSARVDESKQKLVVVVSQTALRPTELGGGAAVPLAPLSPSGYGAVLNYDVLGTFTGQQNTGGALLDLRAYGPYGLLQTTGLANISLYGQQRISRLDTTYTYSEVDALRRWRAGDVVTGALSWSRAVRLGGVQMASDFGLRPDLVTYPLPAISSSAAVPSTVNVMVDGIRQLSEPVQPGPFSVRTLPVVTGAGEVVVAVDDALGRQTFITLPFYASTALLKPGLASYSLEGGTVRQNYGLSTDRYSGWAASGSSRYGLTDWLTLEGHGEATPLAGLLGVGAAVRLGTLGIVTAAVSGSGGRGGLPAYGGGNTGGLFSAGFQRVSSRFSVSLGGTFSTAGYHDIAAVYGSPVPKSTFNASVGYQLGAWGNIGVAYVNQVSRPQPPGSLPTRLASSIISNPRADLFSASYSIPVANFASFFATGFKDIKDRSYGAEIGITFALGGSTSASIGGAIDTGHPTSSVNIARYALEQNDYGYRLLDTEGATPQRSAEAEFLGSWGRVSAGVDQSPGRIAGRAEARGAIVWADGNLFTSDQINDSFAVVNTGDVAGVPVLYQNRLVCDTNADGRLLVPSLLSYQNNLLAIDATRLPPDIDVGQTSMLVRPLDRTGVVIHFPVRKVNAALLKLLDRNGRPVPLGSVAKVTGAEDQPVGYDGEAYVIGLKATNHIEVDLADGTKCVVQFDYKPVKGDIPVIGPLRCQ
jgi:outer membrane usher protein